MSVKERLDQIRERISNADFLANKGLANEVGVHVFCYDPKDELVVQNGVEMLQNATNAPFRVRCCDLYEIFLSLLEKKKTLNAVAPLEKKRGKDYLLAQLQKIAAPEKIIEQMQEELKEPLVPCQDVLFVTGVGKVHPFMRAHKLLDNMQHIFDAVPIVMFYPGSFDGQTLVLFNEFVDGHYYRAFNLLAEATE
jgi:hypothetical protein